MGVAKMRMMAAVTLLLGVAAASAADLTVRVDARDVQRKHVHTDLTLAVRGGGPLTLVFPKWIPGEHGPNGPLESMIGLVIRANGTPLAWQRDPRDMYALTVTVPAGVAHLDIALDSGLTTEGGEFGAGPTSSAQLAVLPFNLFVLLPKGRDAAEISTEATVRAPPGWQLSCALDLHPQTDGSVALEPASLSRLIDSPVQMGAYVQRIELAGSAPYPELHHVISIAADSAAALTTPPDFAAGYGRLVAQAGALFGTRMYRHYTWLLSLSDHVAHFGLEHHESSDDRLFENTLSDEGRREGLTELLAHEYVHSWNGKYRRPALLLSPDYDQPMDGSLLWVYEGLTQFWGTVLPVRAGLVKPESYREMLAAVAGGYDIQPGDRWRPLADTAVAAQVLYGSPRSWSSSRRGVDFYAASELLWLNVDTQLRNASSGHASLDDFMQRFYAGKGGAPALKPYVESDVYATLAAVAPGDWRALIRRHLDTLGPAALLAGLESSGWKLEYSAEKNSYVEEVQKLFKRLDRRWSIGLQLDDKDVIGDSLEDRAAARAGAGPGMKLVAVNGRKFSAEVLDAAIAAAHQDRKPIELLVESAEFYRTLSVAYFDGPRYPHLTRIPNAADHLSEVLKARSD
jgi:predicted metalloprotease with PDZ domain